ncbi:MAG: GNAT family N-acetyltransferase [Saprospiraceae bacterium]|nr:GNAT family N-acetyltransferase [Candidatus Brachybacter algidus]
MSDSLTYIKRIGADTSSLFEELAALRIEVFRDYPYLYEGSLEYEKEYLRTYSRSADSMIFSVYDGGKMVGATTCIPLIDESKEVIEPFINSRYKLDEIFYFGESILLKPYRGLGLGHRFFDEREKHALSFGNYKFTCFCAVQRPDDHPKKPDGYRPNDKFWLHRGYAPEKGLVSEFEWLDMGKEKPTKKPMMYWMRATLDNL